MPMRMAVVRMAAVRMAAAVRIAAPLAAGSGGLPLEGKPGLPRFLH